MAAASVGSTNPAPPPETADRTGPEGILPGQPPPAGKGGTFVETAAADEVRLAQLARRIDGRTGSPGAARAGRRPRLRAWSALRSTRRRRTAVRGGRRARISGRRRTSGPRRRSCGPKSSANRMAAGRRSGPYGPHGRISTQGDRSPKRPVRRLTANRRTSRRSRTRGGGVRRLLRRLRCAVRATERGYEQERRLQVHIPVIFLISLSLFRASIGVSESMSSPRI